MVLATVIGVLSIGGAVLGHLLSRGTGIGISLFMAIWTAFLSISVLGIVLPGKMGIPRKTRTTFSVFIWFLWLGQGLIWTTILFAGGIWLDGNDFGYIAKDNIFLVWLFPLVLVALSAVSIWGFVVAKRNQGSCDEE